LGVTQGEGGRKIQGGGRKEIREKVDEPSCVPARIWDRGGGTVTPNDPLGVPPQELLYGTNSKNDHVKKNGGVDAKNEKKPKVCRKKLTLAVGEKRHIKPGCSYKEKVRKEREKKGKNHTGSKMSRPHW